MNIIGQKKKLENPFRGDNMMLEDSLQKYLDWCLEEKPFVTVEMSFHRDLTRKEILYMNEKLKPIGHYVVCFPCETCKEYSDGKDAFHIDRLHIR